MPALRILEAETVEMDLLWRAVEMEEQLRRGAGERREREGTVPMQSRRAARRARIRWAIPIFRRLWRAVRTEMC